MSEWQLIGFGAAIGFVIGWKLCAYIMTYKFAWRECCLKHYQAHDDVEQVAGE